MAPPFSSTDYETTIINSSQIKDRGIKGIDIELATIELNNLSAAAIASLSGGGGGLTENSVNSSHIINGTIGTEDISDNAITGSKIANETITSSNILNGTILGTDISFGQISEEHFDASFNTKLEEFGDILKELSRPFGIIRIINESFGDDNFNYELFIYNAIDDEYDSLASAIRLKKNDSFTHFYQVANKLTNMKLVVGGSYVSVVSFNLLQGAELVESDGNELIFCIGESTKYQNIEIGVEVEIII
jgi:hypothetical protein